MASTIIYPNLGTLQVQVQFGASMPNGNPPSETDLLAGCEVLNADIVEGLDVWSTYTLVVAATNQKYFDKIISNVKLKNTLVWVRMGLNGVENGYFRPWEPFVLANLGALAPSAASQKQVLVELADVLYLTQNQNTKAWKGTISKTAQGVLSGAAPQGQQPPFQVVAEESKGEFTLFQSFQEDWHFIRNRLQIRAVNSKGSGGYHLWCRDGKVLFGTAGFQQYGPKSYGIATGSPQSYTQIYFEDSSTLYGIRGGAGSTEVPWSPITRASGVLGSDPSKVLSMGDTSPTFPSNFGNFSTKHTGDNDPSEIQYQAQAKFAFQKEQFYSVRMAMTQQPVIRVGDYITIPNNTDFGLFAGNYWVRSLKHMVRRGAMTTILIGSRGQLVPDGTSQQVQTPGGQPVNPNPGSGGIPFSLPSSPASPATSQGSPVPVSTPNGFNIQTGQQPGQDSGGFGLGTGVVVPDPFPGGG